jgi:hypothetical protein
VSASHAQQAATDALVTYLQGAISGLAVKSEWPGANEKLVYPTLTIFAGKVPTMNRMVETLSVTTPDVNNQVVATEVVGEHDFKMQLDLWCSSKSQRNTILGQLFAAINKPVSLALQLTSYFNDWVCYSIDGHQYMDDEAAAQRQERRVKIDLLVNCRAIRQSTYYAMKHLESQIGTGVTDAEVQNLTVDDIS